jgi:hypothetical protein
MIGDVEITARVAALERVNVATKAGVMLRDTLSSSSTHASLLVNAAQGIVFERRRVAGGPSLHSIVGTGRTPEWIRLRREGGIVTAYQSADGRTWVKNGTAIVVSPTIYVGLAVTSHDTAAKATALFDYVVTRRPNEPPSVLLTSPADHAAFVAPATVPIAAVSDDPDGSVARVDFFADTSWVGSSSAPPYGTTWTGVAEGRYALRALARDNEGAGAISTSRSILVIREGSSYALFVPSTNHESAVADYVLDIFAAGDDPATDPAVATISLGKPTIVDGECAVDVTTVVDGLPSGTFIATVTAVGPLGSARSHPSPPFAR